MGAIEKDALDQVKADTEQIKNDVVNVGNSVNELPNNIKGVEHIGEYYREWMNIYDPSDEYGRVYLNTQAAKEVGNNEILNLTGKYKILGIYLPLRNSCDVTITFDDKSIHFISSYSGNSYLTIVSCKNSMTIMDSSGGRRITQVSRTGFTSVSTIQVKEDNDTNFEYDYFLNNLPIDGEINVKSDSSPGFIIIPEISCNKKFKVVVNNLSEYTFNCNIMYKAVE